MCNVDSSNNDFKYYIKNKIKYSFIIFKETEKISYIIIVKVY